MFTLVNSSWVFPVVNITQVFTLATLLVVGILEVHYCELLLGVSSGKHHQGVHFCYLAGGGDSGCSHYPSLPTMSLAMMWVDTDSVE